VSTKLFVGSLPWSVNDQKLKETFEQHGTLYLQRLLWIVIPINPSFGFVGWKILQMQAKL
jgi:hypothetical protein